jgi:SCY1-like protein 2
MGKLSLFSNHIALLRKITAPEYALDEKLITASDMYSLGCVIYAVHCKGSAPFKNHGSLGGLRENAGKALTGMGSLDPDLQGNTL